MYETTVVSSLLNFFLVSHIFKLNWVMNGSVFYRSRWSLITKRRPNSFHSFTLYSITLKFWRIMIVVWCSRRCKEYQTTAVDSRNMTKVQKFKWNYSIFFSDRNWHWAHRQGGENQRASRGEGRHSTAAAEADIFGETNVWILQLLHVCAVTAISEN